MKRTSKLILSFTAIMLFILIFSFSCFASSNGAKLPAPEVTSVSTTKNGITVKWEKVENASYYLVYRQTSKNKTFRIVFLAEKDETSFTDKNAPKGIVSGYVVRGIDENGNLGKYNKAKSVCHMTMPKMVKADNATTGVKLTWTKSEGAEGYKIYRRDGGSSKWKYLGSLKGADRLSATDKTAQNGKKYVYTVRGYHNGVMSIYDATGKTAGYLACPTGFTLKANGETGNVLKWNKNTSAKGYYVYRKALGGSWEKIAGVTANTYTDKKAGYYNYSYYVRAVNGKYQSAASTVLSTGHKVNPNGKMVALTYDDGPNNSVTNQILDVLQKYNSRATFFVVGCNINANHQPMERAVKLGCEIGNHTYNHANLPSCSYDQIRYQVDETDRLVKKYTGITPKVMRAPGGSTSSYSREVVGKPFFYWSVDTRDWESRNAYSVISMVKSYTRDGSIILMHDIYQSTADASREVIPWLVNQGYQLVTVSELMAYRNIKVQSGVTYFDGYR